jgi:hypothetical protein
VTQEEVPEDKQIWGSNCFAATIAGMAAIGISEEDQQACMQVLMVRYLLLNLTHAAAARLFILSAFLLAWLFTACLFTGNRSPWRDSI